MAPDVNIVAATIKTGASHLDERNGLGCTAGTEDEGSTCAESGQMQRKDMDTTDL